MSSLNEVQNGTKHEQHLIHTMYSKSKILLITQSELAFKLNSFPYSSNV